MAAPRSTTDPRLGAPSPAEGGVLPVVALPRQGLPRWLLIAFAALAAILLFVVLDARRRAVTTPAETAPTGQALASAPPPPLYVPPAQPVPVVAPTPIIVVPPATAPRIAPAPVRQQPQIVYVPQPAAPVPQFVQPPAPTRVAGEPALVIDNTGGQAAPEGNAAAAQPGSAAGASAGQAILGARARAGMLANRSMTVPQGTLIPATMETAFDSTRPGLARAIVARDVRGFDGSRVLIPRGSRLIGEYSSDVAAGQNRALVNWVRLIRPDGVTIQIGSPATDPLGRGGIRANVNSHFFQRFAGAILRSAVDVGLALATTAASGPVVLIPGGIGAAANPIQPREITPTLTVRAGTSISVFVARDLDFSGVERQR
jgi:type IV secretion system protein VirB10